MEQVDDLPSHGQVPGSAAYEQRLQDAVPDEVETITEGRRSRAASIASQERPRTPGGTLIPRTVVEKVDPSSPSYGDVPGTDAYAKRLADAPPDVVLKAPEPGSMQPASYNPTNNHPSYDTIPETVVTRVDTRPAHGEFDETEAREMRKEDAEPDEIKIEGHAPS